MRRRKAICELVRILRVGGQVLVYVWALEQERGNVKSKYLKSSRTSAGKQDDKLPTASVDDRVPALPVHINRTAFEAQDVFVPWHLKKPAATKQQEQDKGKQRAAEKQADDLKQNDNQSGNTGCDVPVLHRYYHTFVEGELEELCRTVDGVSIVDSYYDQGNWCVILKKTN